MTNIQDVTVSELMTGDVITVDFEDTIADVRRNLTESALHAVPVMAEGDIVGVLTLSDCHDANGYEIAADAIANPPISIEATSSVAEAATIMHDEHIHHLPTTDEHGNLIGILSSFDLLRLLIDGSAEG